jgi:outer membrane usher protein FimD/PapC
MQRITAGDFFASSGDLGSTINLGGFSYSKIYRMDPYFIKNPMLDIAGLISLPSDAEIYLNGMRVRTEKLLPGEFMLKNISYYGGASILDVVIKDSLGREQRIISPFYFTDILLKKGIHEYSYNMGFMREEFGVESNRYSDLALSAFHRYGIGNSLTLGFRAEATEDLYNLGPQTSYLIPNAGIITMSLASSIGSKGKTGFAGSLNHTYQGRKVNTRLLINGFTEDYSTIISEPSDEKTKYEVGAGIGYSTKDLGSVALDFTAIKKYRGQDRQAAAVTYSRNLSSKVTIFGTFKNIREEKSANEFFIGISYYPGKDTSISARYERSDDTNTEVLEVQKNSPMGEGFGYRASFERADSNTVTTNTVNPLMQYNARYGIYTAECRAQSGGTGKVNDTYQLSASGGVAYIGNTFGFSRPINDSFGLVKVGETEGVRVYLSNEEIGRTDSSGKVFVPNLNSYYDNQVSIGDKDIPINYSISEVTKYISPPFRSGSLIKFDVMKFQAITGKLEIKVNGEVKPAEFYEVRMAVDGKELTFPTGKDGEFYLEDIKPGRYTSSFKYMEKTCSFDIIIPESEEIIIDLGKVVCEAVN